MKKTFFIYIIIFCLLFQNAVYADTYQKSFRNELGELVSFTISNNGNTSTATVGNISISASDPDTAYVKMRKEYMEKILMPKAKVQDPELYSKLLEDLITKQSVKIENEDEVGKGISDMIAGATKLFDNISLIVIILCMIAFVSGLLSFLFASDKPGDRHKKMMNLLHIGVFIAYVSIIAVALPFIIRAILLLKSNIPTEAMPSVYVAISGDYLLKVLSIFVGVAVIVAIAMLIIRTTQMGTSLGNPQKRTQAIEGLLYTCLVIAVLGSIVLVFRIILNIF